MNTAVAEQLTDSFLTFFEQSRKVFEIKNEDDYQFALDLLEQIMTTNKDSADNPVLHLIDIIADSIEKYEDSLEEMQEYMAEVDALDPAISTLRVLIDQYDLTYSDLSNEIGSKSLVSQILSGSKNLTRNHIAKLSTRFNISPGLFF